MCVMRAGEGGMSRKLLNSLGSPMDNLEVLVRGTPGAYLFPLFLASCLSKYKILVSRAISGYLFQ